MYEHALTLLNIALVLLAFISMVYAWFVKEDISKIKHTCDAILLYVLALGLPMSL